MRELIARLLDWTRRDRLDRELQEELHFHQQQLKRDAAPPTESTHASHAGAPRRLGNITSIREAARERWSVVWLDHLQQDTRYALRGLRRNPGFTTVVVLTLALGLGVNGAVFSLLDRVFNRPPAGVERAESLKRVYLTQQYGGKTVTSARFNYPQWQDLQPAFGEASVAVYATDSVSLGEGANTAYVASTYTDAAYWTVLGISVTQGRTFSTDETRMEVPTRVAIISHALWQRLYKGEVGVIAKTIRLSCHLYDIIGVAPQDFTGLELSASDVWLPLGALPMDEGDPGRWWYHVRGIPKLDIVARAPMRSTPLEARLTSAYRTGSIAGGYGNDSTAQITLGSIITARGPMTANTETTVSTRLAWVSVLVFLIACANVTNLVLTRLVERRREFAVRIAIGVSRTRLATQLMVETMALGAIALMIAFLIGSWCGGLLRTTLLPDVKWTGPVIEARVLLALFAVTAAAAVAIAMVALFWTGGISGNDALKSGQRATDRSGARARSALVVAQVSLAVVLLTAAGLCIQSFRNVLALDIGYDVGQVAFAAPLMLGERGGQSRARDRELGAALETVARTLERAPAIQQVALSKHSSIGGMAMVVMRIPGFDSVPTLDGKPPFLRTVSGSYWSTVGMAAVSGRLSNEFDVAGSPPVVVVNETMARVVWHGQNPIGRCIMLFSGERPCRSVIGVVRDTHLSSVIEAPTMQMYVPLAQGSATGGAVVPAVLTVRARPGKLAAATSEMTRVLRATIPNALLRVSTLQSRIEPQYRPWRLGAVLFTVLGVLGLLVASLGLYGVVAYSMRMRWHELAIRVALGAQARDVLRLIGAQGLRLSLAGAGVGLVAALVAGKWIQPLLYQQAAADPRVYLGVIVLMVVVALLASVVPAVRAVRVNPNAVLRGE